MHVETGMECEPGANLGMLVRGVVIDDEMEVEFGGHAGVQVAQEVEELLVPVARLAFGKHGTGGDVEHGKQDGGAVTNIIMSHAFHIAQPHRQHRLGTVEGLDLALLIDAQDQSMIGRVQVETDNVTDLFDEEGIGREFETAPTRSSSMLRGRPGRNSS
jgi:hypothetical protein